MTYILETDTEGRGTLFMVGKTTETRAERIARLEQLGHVKRGCKGCQEVIDAPDPVMVFAPSHTASTRCESGRHPHCTCDTCF